MRHARFFFIIIGLLASACSPGPRAIDSDVKELGMIGGTSVQESELLAQHLVLFRSIGPSARHFCSGTLISSDLVLTAAHCAVELREDGEALRVRNDFEMVFATQTMTPDTNRVRLPKEIFIHPRFDSVATLCQLNAQAKICRTLKSRRSKMIVPKKDLAIIRLNTDAPDSSRAVTLAQVWPTSPVKVIVSGAGLNRAIPGGYFKTVEQAREASGRLDKLEFSIDPNSEGVRTSAQEICLAQSAVRSSAAGDSGGPLFIATADRFELLGVYSTMEKNVPREGQRIERLACYMDLLKDAAWVQSILEHSLNRI